MSERLPVPISHGLELQQDKIEEIRARASDQYRRLTAMERSIEDNIEKVMTDGPRDADATNLATLFEKKHTLTIIAAALEDIILSSMERDHDLHMRQLDLNEKLLKMTDAMVDI